MASPVIGVAVSCNGAYGISLEPGGHGNAANCTGGSNGDATIIGCGDGSSCRQNHAPSSCDPSRRPGMTPTPVRRPARQEIERRCRAGASAGHETDAAPLDLRRTGGTMMADVKREDGVPGGFQEARPAGT
jgi:hypothetical protein